MLNPTTQPCSTQSLYGCAFSHFQNAIKSPEKLNINTEEVNKTLILSFIVESNHVFHAMAEERRDQREEKLKEEKSEKGEKTERNGGERRERREERREERGERGDMRRGGGERNLKSKKKR